MTKQMLTAMAAGLMLAAATPAFAQQGGSTVTTATAQGPILSFSVSQEVRSRPDQATVGAGDDGALALVGVDAAGEQLQQRRLAGTVAADQREPVARADIDVEILEQPTAALDEAKAFIRKNGCCHDERLATYAFSVMQARRGQGRNGFAPSALRSDDRRMK